MANDGQVQVQDIIQQLQQPITELKSLLALLTAPLHSLRLLPPQYSSYNEKSLPTDSIKLPKHLPLIQKSLLENVVPTWDSVLEEEGVSSLIDQYFCPDLFSFASPYAGEMASFAYSSLMASPITNVSIRLLIRLIREYPIDRLHSIIFSSKGDSIKKELRWEECVQNVVSVPAKVANYFLDIGQVPDVLEHGAYFNHLCVRCEQLVASLSQTSNKDYTSITFFLTKLAKLGSFPPAPPNSPSQPSFFETVLPAMRKRLTGTGSTVYAQTWFQILQSFSTSLPLRALLTSLFAHMKKSNSLNADVQTRTLVKREARLFLDLCPLSSEHNELWECVSAIILNREWEEGHARTFIGWIYLCCSSQRNDTVLQSLLDEVLLLWSSPDHIKHSLLPRHRSYFQTDLTLLLLLIVIYLPTSSASSITFSGRFISGIGTYISQVDNSVRHYGMLVAEVVAQRAEKKLDFEDWVGEDSDKPWCRKIRELIKTRDVDIEVQTLNHEDPDLSTTPHAIQEVPSSSQKAVVSNSGPGYDSDDSMTGYDSPPSSESNSPTPSELEDIQNDPSLVVGAKKIQKPVYLAQLGAMIRGSSGLTNGSASEEADKIEIALNCAAELIRKKRDFGTELEENAINLAYGLVGLQDNYNLSDFDRKRQDALNALVVCCPHKAAPCIIEEFFKNQYSTNQRYVILNALAVGARELALLTISAAQDTLSFPSKRLPPALHQKYISHTLQTPLTSLVPHLLDGITRGSIERGRGTATDNVPEIIRERRLRVSKSSKITELNTPLLPVSQKTSFTEVAAEFFIAPIINRFWLFLRDEQTREDRTAHLDGRGRYHGAGTGLILNPLVLAHFLRSLALLVHAAHNAPEWLAVIAPEALELAVTLGTRPVSHTEGEDDDDDNEPGQNKASKEASVLTAALELSLVVLDGCLQLDRGRSLSLENTTLLMGAGEWAGTVLSSLESGIKVPGGGGDQETRLRRAAAGVVLKVDEVTSQWRRSMIDTW
ncbi:hypothetical protein L218DRAFT_972425 [Marasmius fiardii PR-910]|nr:hypothetical protein L218DRAFT_972425 [Marasmius fiardii PR-910]